VVDTVTRSRLAVSGVDRELGVRDPGVGHSNGRTEWTCNAPIGPDSFSSLECKS
jgi:hypothetical protein